MVCGVRCAVCGVRCAACGVRRAVCKIAAYRVPRTVTSRYLIDSAWVYRPMPIGMNCILRSGLI